MVRSSRSFSRPKSRFKSQPNVLILCEDTKSSRQYLQDAGQYFRASARVEIAHCGHTDPKGIVKAAVARANQFDRIVCVIDRDTHGNFHEAEDMAKASKKIELIVSYPCFEYWLLLHFVETRKEYVRAGANSAADLLIKDLCGYTEMADYKKGQPKGLFNKLLGERFSNAMSRSPRILADAHKVGNMNPSTRMHDLVSALEELGKVVPV